MMSPLKWWQCINAYYVRVHCSNIADEVAMPSTFLGLGIQAFPHFVAFVWSPLPWIVIIVYHPHCTCESLARSPPVQLSGAPRTSRPWRSTSWSSVPRAMSRAKPAGWPVRGRAPDMSADTWCVVERLGGHVCARYTSLSLWIDCTALHLGTDTDFTIPWATRHLPGGVRHSLQIGGYTLLHSPPTTEPILRPCMHPTESLDTRRIALDEITTALTTWFASQTPTDRI